MRITYHPQRKKTRTTGGSVLTTKMTNTAYEQTISVKNTRLAPVPRLLVRDQIPVSRDAKIKVTLLEPRALADAKGKLAQLDAGVRALWVPRDDAESAVLKSAASTTPEIDAEAAQGMIEWVCEIDAGATVNISLTWEVSAASTVAWARQY